MSSLDHSLQTFGGPDLLGTAVVLNRSELFRAECKRLISETNQARKRIQDVQSKHLDQQVQDIQFFKKELELKLEEIVPEIELLVVLQSRVTKALEITKDVLRVTNVCLDERRKQFVSDDEVNIELRKEWHTSTDVAVLLEDVQKQISEQIRLNRSTKYHLEQDLKEKFQAQSLASSFALVTAHSTNNPQMSKKDFLGLSSLAVTPKEWENISDLNIAKAEQQMRKSMSMRVLVESVIAEAGADMQNQFKVTTEALQLNIHQIKSVKNQMEEKLPMTLSEINRQMAIREDLQRAVAENEQFLALAQSQIALLSQMPAKQLGHAQALAKLRTEVQQLAALINKLQEEAIQSEGQQRALFRCQQELKEKVETMSKSLYIDEVICMQHRERIVIHDF